ncbi:MAG: sigma-54 dependent transcriptional regulator [Verrucomicrobiae bacterium]|nr:sigma-54 dependent transcriptional regulator [Verrucomicrobiae bacterium]
MSQRILIIDDEKDVQYSFKRIFEKEPFELETASSGEEGIALIKKAAPDLVIMDIRMGGSNGLEALQQIRKFDTRLPIIMMTAYGTTQTAIQAMKLGAFDYILKPFDIPKMKSLIESALKTSRDMREVVALDPAFKLEDFAEGIVGKSEAMQTVYKLIGQVSSSEATILITGESGTGKELVARAIYHHSLRNAKPFLAINCAAIPENLLESELFGHEKGAFTGAMAQRIGKFEQCDGGTIFLDEIGDMSPPTQTKLLRVLQEGEVTRIGNNQPIKVNVRVLAATNRPLELDVAEKKFREDLFYRLNVVRLHLPPLRERREDIRVLCNYFLVRLRKKQPILKVRQFSSETLEICESYDWPGNVRELENCIYRAALVSKSEVIVPADLPPEIPRKTAVSTLAAVSSPQTLPELSLEEAVDCIARHGVQSKSGDLLDEVETRLIRTVLKNCSGDPAEAARVLGITAAAVKKKAG